MPNSGSFWMCLPWETAEEADLRKKVRNKALISISVLQKYLGSLLDGVFMIKNDPVCALNRNMGHSRPDICFSHLHMFHLYLNPQPAGKELGKMALWGPLSVGLV